MELERSTGYHLDSKTPGPRFDLNDTIRAVVLEFQSTYLFTLAYEKMHQFYKEVDSWISSELSSAPEGLSNGWFVSNLEFYDLQDSLSDGTLIAMGLSVAVAFSVMLLTTWNIIISLYAIVSIAGTIFVTVGSLVLLGWELNVLESVTISVAVGLSVDFAVHYGVAYRLAPDPDREGKVIFSLSRMGSAIAMAALTTFVAGAMMMPSTVLAYTQLGTFMMLIMCISWAFATFFFQCMCRCLGPQGTCGQIPLPKKLRCNAFSQTFSGAQGGRGQNKSHPISKYQLDSRGQKPEMEHEHYELEPLASQAGICNPAEKVTYEETHICSELFSSRSQNTCMPMHSVYNSEVSKSIKNVASSAVLQSSIDQRALCPLFSQNRQCSCPDPYKQVTVKWSPHSCQQLSDPFCYQCSPSPGAVQIQSSVTPINTLQQTTEGYVHPVQHVLHCSCLQGRLKRTMTQNSLPKNFFLQSVQQLQAHQRVNRTDSHAHQNPEENIRTVPKVMSSSQFLCRNVGPLIVHCSECENSVPNNQKGLCQKADKCDEKGGTEANGVESKKASMSKQKKKAESKIDQCSLQNDQVLKGDQAAKKHLLNRSAGEAHCEGCHENSHCCSTAVVVKCNSVDCQMPNIEANVPPMLMRPELSNESLLIKTL